MIAGIELEYIDPVMGASELPPTLDTPLPADADAKMKDVEAAYPIAVAAWWAGRK